MATGRRFLLSDAIALVLATAIGLTVVLPYYATMKLLDWTPPIPQAAPFNGWIKGLWGCLVLAAPLAMAWTLAILALRLRRPRDRWSRLVRQPGLVAGLMAASVLAWRLVGFATMCARLIGRPTLNILTVRSRALSGSWGGGWPPDNLLFETDHYLDTMATIGVAVASSWILLLSTGRWRAEASWIDRAGRVLGWFWIAALPLTSWWDFHVRF
jgi:hypothetical protein